MPEDLHVYASHEISGAWNMLISEHCVYPAHFRQDGAGPCLCISGLSGTADMPRTEVLYEPTASCLLRKERGLMSFSCCVYAENIRPKRRELSPYATRSYDSEDIKISVNVFALI